MFTDCCTLSISIPVMPQEQETLDDLTRSRRAALSPAQYNAESPIKDNFSTFSEDGIPVVSRQIAKSVHIFLPVTIPLSALVRQSSAVVTGRKYKGFRKDGTGFRVYNAWWQHRRENKIRNDPRVVVQHATDAPIRPHHRSGIQKIGL